ncbi:formate acetyltransferase activating enzyme [Staphylococcus piscifermentans]|uniref:Pyruvate formate-lyase-activating enzyme n=1 Tax=Staphylococcus piscifermentans TaxID=70258 RepID=A0A239TLW7_9STAP|nr:pyruvate formate-lyase-activating protein [Staphylococcus piscifermentans]RTX86163.1 pyruvate formate lyase-activating protein [Staphylococcus piscifermentans]GEP84846.1 pyruvate formate-lyase-activating enzyme [Staphylococcus piscifermentans]SNU98582.1 formate acetyltransferase activating enzyme [Staphylococcus piscifermentans]
MEGRIHSVESLGTVDGPGLRYIIFTQGCLLRCLYCHNPDTWNLTDAPRKVSAEELVAEILPYRPYFSTSDGGVTVSGGEPLLQMPFLELLFQQLKAEGIHTCIDTSAGCVNETPTFLAHLDNLLNYTDLILLDLKHIDNDKHLVLTGKPNQHILKFAQHLSERKQPVWIRHVLVPGYTDDEDDLIHLGKFIATLDNVERFEILPYHQLGVHKYEALGQTYPLEGVQEPSEADVARAYELVNFQGATPLSIH